MRLGNINFNKISHLQQHSRPFMRLQMKQISLLELQFQMIILTPAFHFAFCLHTPVIGLVFRNTGRSSSVHFSHLCIHSLCVPTHHSAATKSSVGSQAKYCDLLDLFNIYAQNCFSARMKSFEKKIDLGLTWFCSYNTVLILSMVLS